jgi:hypothetical protein
MKIRETNLFRGRVEGAVKDTPQKMALYADSTVKRENMLKANRVQSL